MGKKFTGYVVPIVALGLSIILKIASSSHFIDELLLRFVKEEKIGVVKSIIEIVDYAIFVVPLGIQAIVRAKKAAQCREVISKFGQSQRELVSHILKENGFIEGTSDDINIRVFKKVYNRLILEDKMKFCARDIKGKLSFSINKKEGLCTKAYSQRFSMLEVEDASKKEYNLNSRQKALAGQLKFIVAVPICSDTKNTVKRVICFDSFQRIAKNGCEEGILKICEQVAYNLSSIIDQ